MLTVAGKALRIAVRVQPRASRDRVVGCHGSALKVQVAAPPVEGAANRAVVELLAQWLGVPRRALRVVRGESGREKVVEVECDDPTALAERIRAAVREEVR